MPLAPLVPNTDANEMTRDIKVADQLVTKAHQTGATVTFIEDGSLLADVGGAGAFLRYRLDR
jgi:peptide subunit release factor 1 (eRF1)